MFPWSKFALIHDDVSIPGIQVDRVCKVVVCPRWWIQPKMYPSIVYELKKCVLSISMATLHDVYFVQYDAPADIRNVHLY